MRLYKTPLFLAMEISFVTIIIHLLLIQSELIFALLFPSGYFLGSILYRYLPKIRSLLLIERYTFMLFVVILCFLAVFNPHSTLDLDKLTANIAIFLIALALGLRQAAYLIKDKPTPLSLFLISGPVVILNLIFLPPLALVILVISLFTIIEERLNLFKILTLSGILFFSFYLTEKDISRFFVQKFYAPSAPIKITHQSKSFGQFYYTATSQIKKSEFSFHTLKKLSQDKKETYFQNRILRESTNDGQNMAAGQLIAGMLKKQVNKCIVWSTEAGHLSTALSSRCNSIFILERNKLQKKFSQQYFSSNSSQQNENKKILWISQKNLLQHLPSADLVVFDDYDISFSEVSSWQFPQDTIIAFYCNKKDSCSLANPPDKDWIHLQSLYRDSMYVKKTKGLQIIEAPLWQAINFSN